MESRACELCTAEAAVFCPSDSAFLCWSCDAEVHEANFLVARHIRQPLCSSCNKLTDSEVSGVGFHHSAAACGAMDDDFDSISFNKSSSCNSSTTSPVQEYNGGRKESRFDLASSVNKAMSGTSQRVRSRVDCYEAEDIFVNWNGKLGVGGVGAVRTACSGLRVCLDRWKILPFRVCLAASMWLGLKLGADRTDLKWQVLKRLENISGVPAKVIVAAESKLVRALRAGRVQLRLELEEGWAECSP